MSAKEYVRDLALLAKAATNDLRSCDASTKSRAILKISEALKDNVFAILKCNRVDLERAVASGCSPALLDRLRLDEQAINAIAESAAAISSMQDVIGEISGTYHTLTGMRVGKMRVPLGTIAVIYESRPNVTVDAACLALKSGNTIILRGGSEAIETNKVLIEVIYEALLDSGINRHCIQYLEDPDRSCVDELIKLDDLIDVLIPRGGTQLIDYLTKNCRIPMMKHLNGVCHVYVDSHADLDMALEICIDSKCQRPSTCNACETFLVNESIADDFLPSLSERLAGYSVKVHACEKSLPYFPDSVPVSKDDFHTEWLGLDVCIRVVPSIYVAVEHINHYGSHHTDCIVSDSLSMTQQFLSQVDSAVVLSNVSTRMADGGEFGLGAEIGTSTGKLHARGPVGALGLTTQKTVVHGAGQLKRQSAESVSA